MPINTSFGQNITSLLELYQASNSLTGNLLFPIILGIMFIAITVLLRNSKLGLPSASLVCMVLSFTMLSVGLVGLELALIFMTLFVITSAFTILKK